MLAWAFASPFLPRKLNNFLSGMTSAAAQTPPYSWLRLSSDQVVMIGILLDVVNIGFLLTWPRMSGLITILGIINRQFFLRYNEDNPSLPYSPLCAYKAPHCGMMDLFHLALAACALLVYTSDRPLPEMTLKLFRMWGFELRWVDRLLAKFRQWLPEKHEHVIQLPRGPAVEPIHAEKPAAAMPSEAARKNI